MDRSIIVATICGAVLGGLVAVAFEQTTDAKNLTAAIASARVAVAETAVSHCEIPCGIYNDHDQIDLIRLDATTIQKANAQIQELMVAIQASDDPVANAQLANTMMRWIMVKEEHSKKIQHTVGWYFMTQKIKAPAAGDAKGQIEYWNKLAAFHAVSVAAMKAAQSTDPAASAALFSAIDVVGPWYPAG
jgi:nickel superoxide dismutase